MRSNYTQSLIPGFQYEPEYQDEPYDQAPFQRAPRYAPQYERGQSSASRFVRFVLSATLFFGALDGADVVGHHMENVAAHITTHPLSSPAQHIKAFGGFNEKTDLDPLSVVHDFENIFNL